VYLSNRGLIYQGDIPPQEKKWLNEGGLLGPMIISLKNPIGELLAHIGHPFRVYKLGWSSLR
jgi:hypothetical protein